MQALNLIVALGAQGPNAKAKREVLVIEAAIDPSVEHALVALPRDHSAEGADDCAHVSRLLEAVRDMGVSQRGECELVVDRKKRLQRDAERQAAEPRAIDQTCQLCVGLSSFRADVGRLSDAESHARVLGGNFEDLSNRCDALGSDPLTCDLLLGFLEHGDAVTDGYAVLTSQRDEEGARIHRHHLAFAPRGDGYRHDGRHCVRGPRAWSEGEARRWTEHHFVKLDEYFAVSLE